MKGSARRLVMYILLGLLLGSLMAGCTLAGANAAPLTPVVPSDSGAVQPENGEPQEDAGAGDAGDQGEPADVVPTPTEAAPVDLFGTQTAQAPPPEDDTTAEDDGEGSEPGEGEVEETSEPTEEPTDEVAETPEAEDTPVPEDDGAGGGGTDAESGSGTCPATHTVQAGENLYRIALKYDLTTQQLAAANGITNPDQLVAGTVLNIPECGSAPAATGSGDDLMYTIQPGDNLFRIALEYNLTWTYLAQYNGINNPDDVEVGQVIRIPR